MQTYVLQLRRLIGSALSESSGNTSAKVILRTERAGYLLDLSGGWLDVTQHAVLAAQGHKAMRVGDFETAKASLEAALALWRGPAYADVAVGPRLSAQATLLEESRKTILERRIAADLHLGLHHEILPELAALTAEHTTHERLHSHLMVALYRTGRRSEALATFGRLREALASELGVDPTPSTARLHHSILVGDPALETGAEPGAPPRRGQEAS